MDEFWEFVFASGVIALGVFGLVRFIHWAWYWVPPI